MSSHKVKFTYLASFRIPSRCKWDLRSSEMLSSVDLYLVTDVWGQLIGPIFTGLKDYPETSETKY